LDHWTKWFDDRQMPAAQIWIEKKSGFLVGPTIGLGDDQSKHRCGYAIKDNGVWREATEAEYQKNIDRFCERSGF